MDEWTAKEDRGWIKEDAERRRCRKRSRGRGGCGGERNPDRRGSILEKVHNKVDFGQRKAGGWRRRKGEWREEVREGEKLRKREYIVTQRACMKTKDGHRYGTRRRREMAGVWKKT